MLELNLSTNEVKAQIYKKAKLGRSDNGCWSMGKVL